MYDDAPPLARYEAPAYPKGMTANLDAVIVGNAA